MKCGRQWYLIFALDLLFPDIAEVPPVKIMFFAPPVIVFFSPFCFLNQCSKGEDPLDLPSMKSVPRVFTWSLLFRFISSRCNKLSQKLQIWWPWSWFIRLSFLFSYQSQDASHHPTEYLICFPRGHCCSHFLPLHPLSLLMLLLSALVKCQMLEYVIYIYIYIYICPDFEEFRG